MFDPRVTNSRRKLTSLSSSQLALSYHDADRAILVCIGHHMLKVSIPKYEERTKEREREREQWRKRVGEAEGMERNDEGSRAIQ